MAETYFVTEALRAEYWCDSCDSGKMVSVSDIVYISNPPKYPHKCSVCGYKKNLTDRYPRIVYQGVDYHD